MPLTPAHRGAPVAVPASRTGAAVWQGKAGKTALAIALAFVPTSALAAGTGADTWTGKAGDFIKVQLIRRDNARSQAEAVITYTCAINGSYSDLVTTLKGPIKHNKIKFSGPTDDGTGTAKIHAKLSKPKAKGEATVNESQGSCQVDGDFKAKYKHVSGG